MPSLYKYESKREDNTNALRYCPAIVWLTGLSGAGKTTVAQSVVSRLKQNGQNAVMLDGDQLRKGLNRDLSFSAADRHESVRRAAETARLMAGAGLIVLVALISPYRAGRDAARRVSEDIPFLEVFVDTPQEVCEARDTKGLYAKARSGLIRNFTGITDPYEIPENPDLVINTTIQSIDQSTINLLEKIYDFLNF